LDNPKAMSTVSIASMVVALLQNLCAAILAVNGIRVGIGLAALAAGSVWEPVRVFHRDAIRIPMLIFAVLGAVVNLAVLGWIWRLRARPEAQWRRQLISKKQRRSERLQVAMALLTLALVGSETLLHAHLHHHRRQAPAASLSEKVPAAGKPGM
jgi:hypothetical protein